jgi:hypothetical protein
MPQVPHNLVQIHKSETGYLHSSPYIAIPIFYAPQVAKPEATCMRLIGLTLCRFNGDQQSCLHIRMPSSMAQRQPLGYTSDGQSPQAPAGTR